MLLLFILAKERLAREEPAAVVQNPRLLLHSLRLLAPLVRSMERDDDALELLHGESRPPPLAPSSSSRLDDTDSDSGSGPWPIPAPKPRCGTRPTPPPPAARLTGGCRCTSRPPPLGTGEAARGDEEQELDTEG